MTLFRALHAIWHLVEIVVTARQNESVLDGYQVWLETHHPSES
jgi:hypothetical protein